MAKNIGIVRNVGFIKFLCGDERLSHESEIFFRDNKIETGNFVSFELIAHWQGQNVDSWRAGNVIVLEIQNLPCRIVLEWWTELSDKNKSAAFVKYFDELNIEETCKLAADLENFLSPVEIIKLVKDKTTYSEKFLPLVENCVAQSSDFDAWAEIILASDLPPQIILEHWNKLNDENKSAAFVKYFDDLNIEETCKLAADLEKFLSPAEIEIDCDEWNIDVTWEFAADVEKFSSFEEIVQAIEHHKTFLKKIPAIIANTDNKFFWAVYLLENRELFLEIEVCEDVMIFFMYEAVKRSETLRELSDLIKLLQKKEDTINAAPRVKIVYSYICAGFAYQYARQTKNDEYLSKCRNFMEDANVAFTTIFNGFGQMLEEQARNPAENFSFPKHAAHVLPPCGNHYVKDCFFCEAVTWSSKNCNFCPRLYRSDEKESCFRINPNLELSAENWSVIELTAKLGLVSLLGAGNEKYNREFFTRIGGEFNRLYDLQKRLKCRECGHYMRSVKKYAKWKSVKNIRRLTWHEHFAIFTATTFSCRNEDCSDCGKEVYLSYCWHCGTIIDSRDNLVRIGGYYSCLNCGAGYRDNDKAASPKYALVPGTICPSCIKCPKCGGQEFLIVEGGGKYHLQCADKNCGHLLKAPQTFEKPIEHKIFKMCECSSCHEQKLKWNVQRLENYLEQFDYTPLLLS